MRSEMNHSARESFQFLFRFIWREKGFFFAGLGMTAFVSGFAWLGPRIIEQIIDQGLIAKNKSVFLWSVFFLALSELGRLTTVFFSQLSYAKLGQNVIEQVRREMVSHLLKLPIPYFDQVTSGSMMTRIVNDVNSLTDFFQSGFVSVLGNFASVLAIFFGLYSLNIKLALYLTFVFIPILIVCSIFSNRLRAVYEETRNRLSELNSKLADFLFGMRTVRALSLGGQKYGELNQKVKSYTAAQMSMINTYALFHPVLSLGIGVMLLILLSLGLPMISTHELLVGQWVAALSYVMVLQQPLVEISDRWNFFLAGITSIRRIREIFAETPENPGFHPAQPFSSIEFKQVSFAYPESKTPSLRNVDLTLRRGDWVGIHGESGSGKSTLLQMLYGFYHPSLGEMKWNGVAYSGLQINSLRQRFGVVEQFPFLFHGTVRENITLFGRFPLSLLELEREFSGYHLIQSLLGMLDFQISERGENLSMGQKQMITFLRAYLAKPEIWVLDEATAFFDAEAESEVLQALKGLKPSGITVIQVAHRPEALVGMDRMISVENGQVRISS